MGVVWEGMSSREEMLENARISIRILEFFHILPCPKIRWFYLVLFSVLKLVSYMLFSIAKALA